MKFGTLKKGDRVKVHNKSGNVMLPSGFYEYEIIDTDNISVAVDGIDKWWFCRETGHSYVGDAVILETL